MSAVIAAGPFALLGIAAGLVALAQGRATSDHLTDLPSTTLDMNGGGHRA